MRSRLLDAETVSRELVRMIGAHDRIDVAVAWADLTKPAKALLANRRKFGSVLIRIDFAATDPELITKLVNVPNAYVAASRGGCFHPKMYYFETGDHAEAVVGSANMTWGGMGPNHEASVLLAGDAKDPIFRDTRLRMASYAHLRQPITPSLAATYQRLADAAANSPRPKRTTLPDDAKSLARLQSEVATMDWATFVRKARYDPHHDFQKRMRLLRRVQTLFAGVRSLAGLTTSQWKAIAGVIGDDERETAGLDALEWGWFGSMGGSGVFAKQIGRRNAELALAIDGIPRHGAVTREQYDTFCAAFAKAFSGETRKGRVATASRLLAMKRPDAFVCINKGNLPRLARALAFAPSTLTLDNYWERVIEPVRASP